MQRSRLPLTIALVTFGLSLISGTYAYNKLLRTVPALVATLDVAPGTAITEEMVTVIRVPAGGLPPQALFGPGQIAGMYARTELHANQIITHRQITDQAPEQDAMTLSDPGLRVISLPVRPEAALGGAMRPGDIVDVAAAWPGSEGKPGPVEVLATEVRVIDLRNSTGGSTRGAVAESELLDSAVPTSVLLEVSSQQAARLVGAVESKGAIYLWLVGREHE